MATKRKRTRKTPPKGMPAPAIPDGSQPLSDTKAETFAVALCRVPPPTDRDAAIEAGAAPKSAGTYAWKTRARVDVACRVAYLKGVAAQRAVMSRAEALDILATLARGKLPDFVVYDKETGDVEITIDPADPRARALSEIITRKEFDGKDNLPSRVTRLKLHDPIRALDLLGRWQGWEAPKTLRGELKGPGGQVLRFAFVEATPEDVNKAQREAGNADDEDHGRDG